MTRHSLSGCCARFAIALLLLPVAFAARGDRWDEALARAQRLCAQMTLEEKAGELMVYDYDEFAPDRWGAYTNLVNRNEIGAMMRVQYAR